MNLGWYDAFEVILQQSNTQDFLKPDQPFCSMIGWCSWQLKQEENLAFVTEIPFRKKESCQMKYKKYNYVLSISLLQMVLMTSK